MGTAANTRIGVCEATFNSVDLGYTKGSVTVEYSFDSTEITVDQEDAPIDEIITKQNFVVTVPMAEYSLDILDTLLPGSTLVTDGTMSTKKKLTLSGSNDGSLIDVAQTLILTPTGGTATDKITLYHAVPLPNISFAFEKDNLRVWEVKFRALVGTNGFVLLGDSTATA